MAIEKYTCRCGRAVNKMTSYFKDNVRVTLCDDCAEASGLKEDESVIKVDYDKIVKSNKDENFYHKIDTREKQ